MVVTSAELRPEMWESLLSSPSWALEFSALCEAGVAAQREMDLPGSLTGSQENSGILKSAMIGTLLGTSQGHRDLWVGNI
jgi:hypothetical protein